MIAPVLRPDFRRPVELTLSVVPNPLERPTEAVRRMAAVLVAASKLTDAEIGGLTGVRPRQAARWRAVESSPSAEHLLVLGCLARDTAEAIIAGFALRMELEPGWEAAR